MAEIHILNPDEMVRDEIRKVREIVELAKESIEKSPSKRAYIRMSELDQIFPSKRIEDRFYESLLNNLRKYFGAYNRKYCTNGIFYHIGTVLLDGERIAYIQQIRKTKVQFNILDEADIDGKEGDFEKDNIAGAPIDQEMKELLNKKINMSGNPEEKIEENT